MNIVLKPAKTLLVAVGLCGFLAAGLPAQSGLGAPPGQMGGGVRGGSSGRAAQPSGQIPGTVPSGAQDSGISGPGSSASRPTGSILYPGTPGNSSHGSILSPGLPGSTGQGSILSPGTPGAYRPGSILTPGTAPSSTSPAAYPGGLYSRPEAGRDRPGDRGPGRGADGRGSGRHGRGAVAYPYVYFGYPYGYGNGGYAIDTGGMTAGGVTRTSSSAHYIIEGPPDTASQREPHSRIYEVGPGADGGVTAAEQENSAQPDSTLQPGSTAAPDEAADARPGEQPFYLIALRGGLIYAASEHWLLGNTVHFVTLQGDHYVVSLPEVDLDLSAQLNRERGLKFVLEVREQGGAAGATP